MTDDLSAEERARRTRLIDEARATVERLKDIDKRKEEIASLPQHEISRRLTPACADDAVQRWAADADERERERRAAERELRREARRDRLLRRRYEGVQQAAAVCAGDDWNTWCDSRVADALDRERDALAAGFGEGISELLAKERDATMAAIRDQVRELKIETTSLRSEVIELRTLLAVERGKVVEMPSPLSSRRSVN